MFRSDFIIALLVALIFFVLLLVFLGQDALRWFRTRRVARTGVEATARILDLRDTGNRFNGMPELAIRLEVTPPSGAPFEAELRRVVGLAELERFARGRMLRVRFDPASPQTVALPD